MDEIILHVYVIQFDVESGSEESQKTHICQKKANMGHRRCGPPAGSAGKPLVYFMYPQAETAEGRVDPFDPDNFKYEITARQLS